MLENSFQFKKHYYRNLNRKNVKEETRNLFITSISFDEARRIMRTKDLKLSFKEYYNLRDKGRKRTAQKEFRYVLRTLEIKGFKVRIKEKYMINDNIKQLQKMKFFFFINSKQIRLTKQFINHFIIITNATFNTNENGLPLSILICVINTLKNISIAYCFIEFEFIEAFLFINDYMKNLFFYNNCKGFAMLLKDFAARLTTTIIKKRINLLTISINQLDIIAQAKMNII